MRTTKKVQLQARRNEGFRARRRLWAGGFLAVCLAVAGAAAPRAYASDSPASSETDRLGPRAADIQRVIERANREGLPTDGLASKVREGLAKGASPDAIWRAVERQAQTLGEASALLRQQRKAPASMALVKAVADARAAGVAADTARPVVASAADDARLVRAVEVLTDLALRGYPERGSGALVRDVLERDPSSVGRIPGGLESIRHGQTVSRADALELLGRNLLAAGNSLDAAVNRSLEGREHAGGIGSERNGHGNDHGAPAATKKGMGNGQGPK